MKLYQNDFSTASLKVRAVLDELGVPCEFVAVDMRNGEHKSPAFLAKNPNGKIPVLEDDGFYLWESNAILCYIAAKKPEGGLLLTDPRGLGLMQQWLQWQSTTLGPSADAVMMETVYTRFTGRAKDEAKYAEGVTKLKRDLAILDKALDGNEYLCSKLTIADFAFLPNLAAHTQMGVDLDAFPNVKAWLARLISRESVRKALPSM